MLCQKLQVHGLAQAASCQLLCLLRHIWGQSGDGLITKKKLQHQSHQKISGHVPSCSIQPQCILLGCTSHHKPLAPSGPEAQWGTPQRPGVVHPGRLSSPRKAGRHNPQSDARPLEEAAVPVLNGHGKAIRFLPFVLLRIKEEKSYFTTRVPSDVLFTLLPFQKKKQRNCPTFIGRADLPPLLRRRRRRRWWRWSRRLLSNLSGYQWDQWDQTPTTYIWCVSKPIIINLSGVTTTINTSYFDVHQGYMVL